MKGETGDILIHATAVSLDGAGVVLLGAPGSGKSDLALRLIDAGARLVADDQVALLRQDRQILASAPPTLLGLLEVRGFGILRLPGERVTQRVPVAMLVELVAPQDVERLPEPATRSLLDIALPLLRLAPFEASTPAKLRLAVAGCEHR